MVFKNSLKILLIGSWVLGSFLPLRPSFAMDDLEEVKGAVLTPFFKKDNIELSDDVTGEIFRQIEEGEEVVRNYCSIAFTSKKGYALIEKPLYDILKTYFAHLPKPFIELPKPFIERPKAFIESLIEDKSLFSLPTLHTIFQKLYTHQEEEAERLEEILSIKTDHKNPKETLIEELPDKEKEWRLDVFKTTFKKYTSPKKTYRQLSLREDCLNGTNEGLITVLWRRFSQMLDNISFDEKMISKSFEDFNERTTQSIELRIQNSITRLTTQGAAHIHLMIHTLNEKVQKYSPGSVIYIHVDLSHNNLRWLPDELFTTYSSTPLYALSFDMSNNLLTYLPESIENLKERIMGIKLGNDPNTILPFLKERKVFHQGNSFKELPAPVYTLTNLKILNHHGLGLKKDPSEFFERLPNLLKVRGDHYDVDRKAALTRVHRAPIKFMTYAVYTTLLTSCLLDVDKRLCLFVSIFGLFRALYIYR